MHPDIFSLGPFTVHSYGLMIVLGILFGLFLVRIRANRYGLEFEKMVDLSFLLVLSGIIGAKIFYWVILSQYFVPEMKLLISDPIEFIKNLGSGFEFFGGLFGGVIAFVLYVRKKNLPAKDTLDLLTPAIPAAHALGRIGCFLAGCCYGRTCDLPWSVTFTAENSLAPTGVALHPTQLYECGLLIVLTAFLLIFEKSIRKVKGRMLPVYVIGYIVIRFVVEHFRGDPRGNVGFMSGTQIIAICSAVLAIVYLVIITRLDSKSKRMGK